MQPLINYSVNLSEAQAYQVSSLSNIYGCGFSDVLSWLVEAALDDAYLLKEIFESFEEGDSESDETSD